MVSAIWAAAGGTAGTGILLPAGAQQAAPKLAVMATILGNDLLLRVI